MHFGIRKIAISVPEDILRSVDRLAKKSRTTRSGLITRVLREVSEAAAQSDITARIRASRKTARASVINLSQIHAIDRSHVETKIGALGRDKLAAVEAELAIVFDLRLEPKS